MDRTRLRWTVGRQLAAGFGAVTAILVVALAVTLGYSASAGSAWRQATHWDRAVSGAGDQLRGTQQQMAAQALYVAIGAPRYKAEWQAGVALSNRGAAAVAALHDPTIARIATTANEADHRHDAAVFPAMARGDHDAALAALRQADRFVRMPLGAQRRIAAYVGAERGVAIARAKAAERTARHAGIIAGIVGMLLAAGIALVITRRVVRPLRVVVDRLAMLRDVCVTALTSGLDALARGDLTVAAEPSTPAIENPGADEVGHVARAFNEIRAKTAESLASYTESRRRLAALIGDVSASAGTVSAASQQMATTSEETGRAVGEIATAVGEVAQGAERQVRAVEQAKLASAEVAGASALSAEQAQETSAAAVAAREVAQRGAGAVAEASEAMGAVRDSSLQATEATASRRWSRRARRSSRSARRCRT
jgi:hypothetical protein